jgi:uncharacterized damage-inducible protein DinB
MARTQTVRPDHAEMLVESYRVNDWMNQLVIEHLDPAAWRAKPANGGRTIAAIFCHVHNVRHKWVRLTAPHLKLPAKLDRSRCTQKQAGKALAESAARCCDMIAEALAQDGGRIQTFCRDGWAKPWPTGAAMVAYMLTHDAHHRGQVCLMAHQMGFPLPQKAAQGMWVWERVLGHSGK